MEFRATSSPTEDPNSPPPSGNPFPKPSESSRTSPPPIIRKPTDKQERINQIVETYLRLYINYDQDDWSDFLPLAEFAYNNASHSSTTESPFFLNKGFHPTLDIQLSGATRKTLGVTIDRIRELHEHAKQEIAKALEKNKRNTDGKRQDAPSYSVGDFVFLSTENIRTTRPTKKFSERNLGPFKIIQVVSPLAVKLELPEAYRLLHPVFHVSLLEPAPPDAIPGRRQPPPPPVVIKDEEEWHINAVLDSRLRRNKLEYLVEWTGYEDDALERQTWQPAENLENSPIFVEEFHKKHPDKPRFPKPSAPRLARKSRKSRIPKDRTPPDALTPRRSPRR
ncbi:hypothetical protein MNV49_007861 [Pseudohyphozyma bogoriensis]|nr:hypothetical protein MNV49_007861 [Pseudohyphozyma bogoriensis]